MRCRPRGRRAEKSRSQRTEARHHADSWECPPVGGGLQDPIRAWERPRWEGARIRFAPEQEGNQIAWLRPSDVWLQWPKSDRPLPSNAETKKKTPRRGRPTTLPARWSSAHEETASFPEQRDVRLVFFLSFWRGVCCLAKV
jgi:hypothetical protein